MKRRKFNEFEILIKVRAKNLSSSEEIFNIVVKTTKLVLKVINTQILL